VFEDENRNWEAELHQRLGELLANRLNPLKSELEQLQATFSAVSNRLLEQTQFAPTAAETASLTAQVSEWLQTEAVKTEQNFQSRLEIELASAREQLETELQQRLEAEFQTKLEQSIFATQRETEVELEQLRNQLAVLQASQPLHTAAAASLSANNTLLKTAIEDVNAQRTQSETLTVLINHASKFAPRLVFFVVKSGEAVGWKSLGFENGLSDETARTLKIPIQNSSLIGQALSTQRTAIALNPSQAEIAPLLGRFSHPVPQGVVAIPLVVRGKAAAVLYADSGSQSDEAIQLEAIEALIQVASMAIELLPGRRSAGDLGRPSVYTQPSQTPAAPQATEPAVTPPVTPVSVAPAPQPVWPVEPPTHGAAAVVEPVVEATETFAPVTQNPVEPMGADYTADPVTSRPVEATEFTTEPEPVNEPADEAISEEDQTPSPFSTPEATYTPAVEAAYAEANSSAPVPLQAAAAPASVDMEDEKPSIFDLLRPASGGPSASPSNAGLPLPSYSTPDPSSYGTSNDLANKPGTSLPNWMQRLQEDNGAEEPAAPFPFTAAPVTEHVPSWPTTDETLNTVPQSAPPPPTPPPVRVPSLPEQGTLTAGEAETDRLPLPPAAQAFQPDSPSVRFSFNQPSEPPRYAAPSLSVSNAATETEVRAHNDARRFARLLVSEIKLYNAAKVNEGRRLSDLYDRLKDEIDRSRKVYDKRVSPAVAAKFDYFYDELVQTLAEGDPTKLGENCPGPVVIAT
jgi:hypothetical protein